MGRAQVLCPRPGPGPAHTCSHGLSISGTVCLCTRVRIGHFRISISCGTLVKLCFPVPQFPSSLKREE